MDIIGSTLPPSERSQRTDTKVREVERFGGRCHFVDSAGEVYAVAQAVAYEIGGHYHDQFTNAERVTDWRGNNKIAESIYS